MAKIHIMVSRHSAFYSPLIAAITAGFLKREGLEPTYAIAKNFQSVPDGIRAGTVHVGQSAVSVSWFASTTIISPASVCSIANAP